MSLKARKPLIALEKTEVCGYVAPLKAGASGDSPQGGVRSRSRIAASM